MLQKILRRIRLSTSHAACILITVSFTLSAHQLFAQQVVRGTVKDAQGNPIPGASVNVRGSNFGVTSDDNGTFTLPLKEKNMPIVISSVGYKTQEFIAGDKTSIDVVMISGEGSNLEDVVVIGYGSQSREAVTTSVSKLDNKVLENVPFANPASALQGTIAGLRVQSTTGQPGKAPVIILRGGTSINNPNGSTPLYIIDGVLRDDMDNINSDDIESIQVLKDAAATAIYGARGSNGVIIVVTKSGKSGSTTVNYSYDITYSNNANNYSLLNARDFIHFSRLGVLSSARKNPGNLSTLTAPLSFGTGNDLTNNTLYTTQYLTPENEYKLNEGWESMPDPVDPSKTIIFKNTDFQRLVYRTGVSHNNTLSISGGSDKATFSARVGYLTNEGIAITTRYNRLSFNLNGDIKLRDNIKVFGRLLYSKSGDNEVPNSDWVFQRFVAVPPTSKYRFEDGTLASGPGATMGNPEFYLNNLVRDNNQYTTTMIMGGHWEILPGLSFDPLVSLYNITTDRRSFEKAFITSSNVNLRGASGSYTKQIQTQADAVLSYFRTIRSSHNIDAKVGFSYFGRDNYNLSAAGRGASTDLIPTLNASAVPTAVSSSLSEQVLLGYFGRINYDYDQRYLLSVNARYDGASNLGDEHKWGLFPGISAGWNVHKENFWNAIGNTVSQFKIRGSYGVNGNQKILGPYQAQGAYSVGILYGGNSGIQNTILPNADLKWEQSKTFNVGVDVGLFDNRITLLVDRYRRVTDNLLTSLSLPFSSGFSSILTNLGSLENKGVEIELSTRILPAASKLQWNVSLNAAYVKTKIMKLPDNGVERNRIGGVFAWDPKVNDYTWQGGLQEGGRLGDAFGFRKLGLYQSDEDAAKGPVDDLVFGLDKTKFGGDVIWADIDNNNIIDTRDRVYMGNSYPDWTGGFSSTLAYGNLSMYVRMDYTLGHTIYNAPEFFHFSMASGNNNLSTDVLRSWQNPGDQTDIPKYTYDDYSFSSNVYRGSSDQYEKGDFLAIREITLSYGLPKKLLDRLRMKNLRFNVTAHNLKYFTAYEGLNPELGGYDNGRYPMPRSVIFGANITF